MPTKPRSTILGELLDRVSTMSNGPTSPLVRATDNTSTDAIVTPSNAEQKANKLVKDRQAAYEAYSAGGEEALLKRSVARKNEEDEKNLGRTLGTLLSSALMKKSAAERTGMVALPTVAKMTQGEALRSALEQKDDDDHHTALKSYYDSWIKSQDYLKSIELEGMKQEGLNDRDKPFDTSRMIQDNKGFFFIPKTNKEKGTIDFVPTGIQGPLKDSADSGANRRHGENQDDEARKEIQKIQEKHAKNDLIIRSLNDAKSDSDARDILDILAKENSQFAGMSKTDAVKTLKDTNIKHERAMNEWQKARGWKQTKGWYSSKKEEEEKDPLGANTKGPY